MSVTSYSTVLRAARKLPFSDQVQLAEALLGNLGSALRGEFAGETAEELVPLTGMSEEELKVLAEAVLSHGRQQYLQALLAKNRAGTLSTEEEVILDNLLAEADQVALLKARALYTLKERGVE
ncbi:MAG: hypothetical protein ACE5F6_16420 [Anaerolineae bacterium]